MIVLLAVADSGTSTVTISPNGENSSLKTEITTSDSETAIGQYILSMNLFRPIFIVTHVPNLNIRHNFSL